MTEQPISKRRGFPAWFRALLSKTPTQAPVSGLQRRKLPRIADMLASIGRESGPER